MFHLVFSTQQPLSFVSAGTLIQEDGWIHTERVIDSFEIIIGVEGEVFLQQGEEQYTVRPGNMLLLLPGVVHRGYQPGGQKTSFFWFHFLLKEHELLPQSELADKIWRMSEKAGMNGSQECILPLFCALSPDDKLNILFHQLLHISNTSYYTNQMCNYVLTALLIQLCQNYLEHYHKEHDASRSNRSFAQILEWIRTHSSSKLAVADVAQKFNYNENYFSRMFCKKTGVFFTEYVNNLRVNEAKSLLYRTHLSIKEIAYQVGFSDEKYFMKVFKKAEGISPSQYRNAFYHTHQNIR